MARSSSISLPSRNRHRARHKALGFSSLKGAWRVAHRRPFTPASEFCPRFHWQISASAGWGLLLQGLACVSRQVAESCIVISSLTLAPLVLIVPVPSCPQHDSFVHTSHNAATSTVWHLSRQQHRYLFRRFPADCRCAQTHGGSAPRSSPILTTVNKRVLVTCMDGLMVPPLPN